MKKILARLLLCLSLLFGSSQQSSAFVPQRVLDHLKFTIHTGLFNTVDSWACRCIFGKESKLTVHSATTESGRNPGEREANNGMAQQPPSTSTKIMQTSFSVALWLTMSRIASGVPIALPLFIPSILALPLTSPLAFLKLFFTDIAPAYSIGKLIELVPFLHLHLPCAAVLLVCLRKIGCVSHGVEQNLIVSTLVNLIAYHFFDVYHSVFAAARDRSIQQKRDEEIDNNNAYSKAEEGKGEPEDVVKSIKVASNAIVKDRPIVYNAGLTGSMMEWTFMNMVANTLIIGLAISSAPAILHIYNKFSGWF
ncbi:MAG: hypothetical protein LBF72_02615 [Holosporales bacterium]|jgi:hypothetical protein|nr:hypothetical protein [Holosporales bacterium]